MEKYYNFLYPASLKTKHGTKWGYINERGEYKIPPDFSQVNDFQKNGLATVEIDGNYGCIDQSGQFIIPPKFETMISFSEGRAPIVYEGGFQVINEVGDLLTKKSYNFISSYQEGRAVVSDKDREGDFRYGYLDRNGNEIIPLQYETASDFQDGVAIVKMRDGNFALINQDGQPLCHYQYFFVGNYGDGLLAFKKELNEKFGYITIQGKMVIEPSYSVALPFENGRAVVNVADDFRNRYGLINKSGAFVIEPEFNDVTILGEHRVSVGKAIDDEKPFIGSKNAIANWGGDLLTDFLFDHVSEYDHGTASVNDGERAYFIDRTGNRARGLPTVIGADSVTLIGELVRATKNTRIVYLTKKGELVWRQNTIIPLSSRYRVLEKRYEPNKDYLVYYPQIDGLKSGKVEEMVNKKLRELSNLKEIDSSTQLDYSYTGDFSVEFFQKNLLVMELYGYEYYFGAAHGMPNKSYTNINLINGCFYKLGELFKEDSDYVARLSEIIGEMIKTDPNYDYVFPDAYQGIAEDQPFYVNAENLFIYFAPYEIAPYVAGFPTFPIPFTKISDIIKKKGEFWHSFHGS